MKVFSIACAWLMLLAGIAFLDRIHEERKDGQPLSGQLPLSEAMSLSSAAGICGAEEMVMTGIKDPWAGQSAFGLKLDRSTTVRLDAAEVSAFCESVDHTRESTPHQRNPWGTEEVQRFVILNGKGKPFLCFKIAGEGEDAVIAVRQILPVDSESARFPLMDETFFYRELTNPELSTWVRARFRK